MSSPADRILVNRRKFLQYLASLAPAGGVLRSQAQEAFPSRPIRIVVSSSPGALLDASGRLYAERLAVFLKQPVTVENMPGAGGLLAVRHVAKSPADGYTLVAAANTVTMVPHLNANAGYSVKDFTAVGEMARSPSMLVVGGASPFRSIADLVAAAKKGPGQVSYGSGGVGTTSHLPVELFARQAHVTFIHVPYKGNAVAVPDVASGRVGFMMGTPTSLVGLMKTGGLRALAITAETRSPKFPDIPTFKELGFDDATFDIWVGLLAPAGIPQSVRARLGDALELARKDSTVIARLDGMGQVISDVRTPDQFEAMLRTQEEKYRRLIKDANIVGG